MCVEIIFVNNNHYNMKRTFKNLIGMITYSTVVESSYSGIVLLNLNSNDILIKFFNKTLQ